jgi:hypothetical protein
MNAAVHGSGTGTRLTSICTATIASVDAGPTDVDDTHRKGSVRAAQRPTFYGAVPLCFARRNRPTRTGGVRLVLGHDFDATQLERDDDPLPEHEFHAAMPCCFRPRDEDRAADLEPPDVPCRIGQADLRAA